MFICIFSITGALDMSVKLFLTSNLTDVNKNLRAKTRLDKHIGYFCTVVCFNLKYISLMYPKYTLCYHIKTLSMTVKYSRNKLSILIDFTLIVQLKVATVISSCQSRWPVIK